MPFTVNRRLLLVHAKLSRIGATHTTSIGSVSLNRITDATIPERGSFAHANMNASVIDVGPRFDSPGSGKMRSLAKIRISNFQPVTKQLFRHASVGRVPLQHKMNSPGS